MTAMPVRIDGVSKRFGETLALNDVSLEIGEGEIFGLLGPNGAGKTTLIRTILDVIKPDSGRVEVFGRAFQPGDRDRMAIFRKSAAFTSDSLWHTCSSTSAP